MRTAEELIEEAKSLTSEERRKVIEGLEELAQPAENEMIADRPYASLLAMAGTVHSDFSDLSQNKYEQLAFAIVDAHDD